MFGEPHPVVQGVKKLPNERLFLRLYICFLLSCTLRIKAISLLSWISISNTHFFQRLTQQGRKLDIILDTLIPTIIDFLPGIKKALEII